MYCPDCGAETLAGSKFCKRCGGSLNATTQASESAAPPNGPAGAAWATALAIAVPTVAICLGGLGIVFSHALEVIRRPNFGQPIDDDFVALAVMMVLFGSLTVFGVSTMLIRLLSRLMVGPQGRARRGLFRKSAAGEFTPAQLPALPVGIASVTEHTTRNFEPPLDREMNQQRPREIDRKVIG